MITRRKFLSRSCTLSATSALGLANTACVDIEHLFPEIEPSASTIPSAAQQISATPLPPAEETSSVTRASTSRKIMHTLGRISFGVSSSDLQRARDNGVEAYIEEQLNPESIDDTAVETFIASNCPKTLLSGDDLTNTEKKWTAEQELKRATIHRMLYSKRQLFELMVDFWTNHFNIDGRVGNLRWFKAIDDREVIRKHALGKFRDLLHASAKSPAMLTYLNNTSNNAGGPNENYARELLELHTLGIDGNYTETDIREIARCFTGWKTDYQTISFRFSPGKHDQGEKQVLGTAIPAGRGVEDGEQVLDLLASHPATAQFIAGKLVRRFVADEPPASLIDLVARQYLDTGGDIRAMLKTLLSADEFLNSLDRKTKRPLEFIASAIRTLAPEADNYSGPDIEATLLRLGQLPFGWPAPNGYPDRADYWSSTQGLATRWEFALAFMEKTLASDSTAHLAWLDTITTPAELVDQAIDRVIHYRLPDSIRDELLNAVAGDAQNPHEPFTGSVPMEKATLVLASLLASPFFMSR